MLEDGSQVVVAVHLRAQWNVSVFLGEIVFWERLHRFLNQPLYGEEL